MTHNRRDSERLPTANPVRYQQKGSQRFANSMARDISDNGIGFISNEFFSVSTPLIFEAQHPKSREFIRAPGEIVWISNQPHSE
ncbi:PilZ domain-containing protein, partial [Candidatus Omnitrophota bacterium]